VQPHQFDQRANLGLGAAEKDCPLVRSQAPGQHGEVEHQRRVREHELAEVDDHVAAGMEGADESLTTTTLSGAVLVARAAENRGFVIEVDDGGNLSESHHASQGCHRDFIHSTEDGFG